MKNQISKLYNAVSPPAAASRDALSERLQSVRDTASLLYERAKQKLGYGQSLKDIVEERANQDYIGIEDIKHLYPGEKTQTTDDGIQGMHYLFDEHDMRLIEDGTRTKTWRITKNLNLSLTDTIMYKATPDIEMRTKVIYSFKCEIHRGGGDIIVYGKTKSSTGTLTSLQEIKDFIEQCEMKQLDLEDNDFWQKAYLPAERTIETPGAR